MLFWGRECSLDPAGDCPRDVLDGFANVHCVVLADKLTNAPFYCVRHNSYKGADGFLLYFVTLTEETQGRHENEAEDHSN